MAHSKCSVILSYYLTQGPPSIALYTTQEPQKAFYLTDGLVPETPNKWHLDAMHMTRETLWIFSHYRKAINKVADLQVSTQT